MASLMNVSESASVCSESMTSRPHVDLNEPGLGQLVPCRLNGPLELDNLEHALEACVQDDHARGRRLLAEALLLEIDVGVGLQDLEIHGARQKHPAPVLQHVVVLAVVDVARNGKPHGVQHLRGVGEAKGPLQGRGVPLARCSLSRACNNEVAHGRGGLHVQVVHHLVHEGQVERNSMQGREHLVQPRHRPARPV